MASYRYEPRRPSFDFTPLVQKDIAPYKNNIVISFDFMLEGYSPCYVLVGQPDINKMIFGYEGFGMMFFANNPTLTQQSNIYIVDTNLRAENVRTSPMIVADGALEYYLVGGRVNPDPAFPSEGIVIGKWYSVQMVINAYNAVGIAVWPQGGTPPDSYQVVLGGLGPDTSYEQYHPISEPGDTNFGVYVDHTNKREYFFDNIEICPLVTSRPVVFMQMNTMELVHDAGVVLMGQGTGNDPDTSPPPAPGTEIYIWNFVEERWDDILEITNTSKTAQALIFDISNLDVYRDTTLTIPDYNVNLLIMPTYPSSPPAFTPAFAALVPSELRMDFFKMEQALTSGYHLGNYGDIYIRPYRLTEVASETITLDSLNIMLSPANGFNSHPMVIKSIQLMSGTIVSSDLTEGEDYVFMVLDSTTNYSCHENNEIRFNPDLQSQTVRINYLYFDDLQGVQTTLDDYTDSQSVTSKGLLVYTFHPVFMNMNIVCTLDLTKITSAELQQLLMTWVAGLTDSFRKFDLLTYLTTVDGVEDVDVDNLVVGINKRNVNGINSSESDVDDYALSSIERFAIYPDLIDISTPV